MFLNKVYSPKISSQDKAFESPYKSIIKSVSWRIIGTLDTIIISWYLTNKLTIALSIGSIEIFTKFILYYAHERIWIKINWK